MKLFIKFLLFLLVLACIGPYVLKGPDGQSFLSLPNFSRILSDFRFSDWLPTSGSDAEPTLTGGGTSNADTWIQWSKTDHWLGPDKFTSEQLVLLELSEQEGIYYRWQDDNNIWQFSSLPNKNTTNWVVRTDPNANVLQGLSKEEIDQAFGRQLATSNSITENNPLAKGEGLEQTLPIPTTLPMTEIPKLIEQAKDVQAIMEQRLEGMDKLIDGKKK